MAILGSRALFKVKSSLNHKCLWTTPSLRQNDDKGPPQSFFPDLTKNLDPPEGIFRKFENGEIIGPGADKKGAYPQTEYYSFHEWSFNDFEVYLAQFRCGQPDNKFTNYKPPIASWKDPDSDDLDD